MDAHSGNHETTGFFGSIWWWIRGLLEMFKFEVTRIVRNAKKVGQDDPRRIVHSVKMGLTLALISLLYYFRPIYNSFGVSAMCAVLTVVVVFEFTVGATLGKGFNRGIATLLAGALGVGAHHLATMAGEIGEPVVLGFCVFVLTTAASFTRFFPSVKAKYDYGVLMFILTFSLVSVSGYRVEKIIQLAHQRVSTILIGSFTCVFISIFVCPVWAGEELHNQIATNMEMIGDFLEGFGRVYFASEGSPKETDTSFLEKYKSVLNSKATEETLANFAGWEPCHGGFRFRHPWKQYLKIGGLIRQCAYQIEALNSYIHSEVQASPDFKKEIQDASISMSSECAKALSELASAVKAMTDPYTTDIHVSNAKAATNNFKITLKTALPLNTDLLQVIPAVTVTSLLIEIVLCTEKIAEAVHELARLAKFKNIDKPIILVENPKKFHMVTIKPVSDMDCPQVVIRVEEQSPGLTHSVNLVRALEN